MRSNLINIMTRYCFLLVLGITLLTERSADASTFHLRALSYNCGSGAHIPLDATGIKRIAEEIVQARADVVGFTELDLGTCWYDGRDLAAELRVALAARGYPMHGYQSMIMAYMDGWMVHGILSRWPILASETRVIKPEQNWKIDHVTIEPMEGFRIDAYLTHIWPDKDTLDDVRRCFDFVNESKYPRFFMGDFNFGYGSEFFKIALDAGFRQTCASANGAPCLTVGQGATISGPLPLEGQIDHIFVSKEVQIIRSYTHYTSVSDHWPIIAELSFPAPPGALYSGGNLRMPLPQPEDAAIEWWRLGNYSESAQMFAKCLMDNPTHGDAAFYLYSSGCMELLSANQVEAEAAFRQASIKYPNSYWGVRALQRLSLLLEEQGNYEEAAKIQEQYIAGYYDVIHPDPRSRALEASLRRLIFCSEKMGFKKNDLDYLAHFTMDYPERGVGRAAWYLMSLPYLERGEYNQWWELFQKSRAQINDIPPVDNVIRKMAFALVALKRYDEADLLHQRFVSYIEPGARRGREGRYWKVRYPEDYLIRLKPGETKTIHLEGARHAVIPAGIRNYLSGRIDLQDLKNELKIHVEVIDVTHTNNEVGSEIWKGDSLQIGIDPDLSGGGAYDADDLEWGIALTGDAIVSHIWKQGTNTNAGKIYGTVKRDDNNRTLYEVHLPYEALNLAGKNPKRWAMNILVNDNDGHGLAGRLEWTPGMSDEKAPEMFPVLEIQSY